MDNSVKDSQKGETHEKLHVNTVGGVMAPLGRRTGVIDDQCRVRYWITTVFINYKKYNCCQWEVWYTYSLHD